MSRNRPTFTFSTSSLGILRPTGRQNPPLAAPVYVPEATPESSRARPLCECLSLGLIYWLIAPCDMGIETGTGAGTTYPPAPRSTPFSASSPVGSTDHVTHLDTSSSPSTMSRSFPSPLFPDATHRRGATAFPKDFSLPSFPTSPSPPLSPEDTLCVPKSGSTAELHTRLFSPPCPAGLSARLGQPRLKRSSVIPVQTTTTAWATENSAHCTAGSQHRFPQTHHTLPLRPSVATFLQGSEIHWLLTAMPETRFSPDSWPAAEPSARGVGGN